MSQLRTKTAEMSPKHGTFGLKSDNIAELARTDASEHSISDSSAVLQSPAKMLSLRSSPEVYQISKGGKPFESLDDNNDDLSTNRFLPRSQTLPHIWDKSPNISIRRGFEFNLSSHIQELTRSTSHAEREPAGPNSHAHVLAKGATRNQIFRSSSLGPLTPPHEVESLSWLPSTPGGTSQHSVERTTDGSTPATTNMSLSGASHVTQAEGGIMSAVNSSASQNASGAQWLLRAFRVASKPVLSPFVIHLLTALTAQAFESHMPLASTKVISQVLPAKAADQRAIKTYEVVCEHLQQILPEPGYVSITHALGVSPDQGVEGLPKSPPATPGFNGADGYFGDQTVFTHVAEVAIHHEFRDSNASLPLPPQRHIMSAEANMIILERYIPPATTDEMSDFFSANSCRSYLADRLPELAVEYGSLLLVYPTRTGGQTFARRYVAPVLDPLLREMTILRNLNTNAAERLGRMRAIDSMLDTNDMRSRLETFCTAMNARGSIKKSRSAFVLAHSETAHVTLNRDTWMTWFVEQEQPRMKQDLVEYHKAGGRLPEGKGGKTDITTGMLTREIVEGLQKSTAAAGNSNIEVGIFVIRRVRRPATG
ncbi:hypothetical protein PMZ80_007563 [Knufia obscura]|uniref:Uncharacterized protein n=2 Tax=Knufia TaxID=430999 RepID=A0AAN8EUP0_9EURO|nr:hypothetical protein PMZ80_007563 [Knufia obscura]KAK5954106.1 hypothetical protein OHC33_004678 [Knufia fluminis]